MDVLQQALHTIRARQLAGPATPVALMVSGGSDSTALAYVCADLRKEGALGSLRIFHVNHQLRGAEADADEAFVAQLAETLGIPFEVARIDVAAAAEAEHGNVEAVARRLRYEAASQALARLCAQEGATAEEGRLFVAHTADDRVENFYMRSIVGTGPGGFRAMRYANGQVARPLLDLGRDELRTWIEQRAADGLPVARDAAGMLWREDATNACTDQFRAFVRHEIVPLAKQRNPRLLATLTRTMNQIADEDDMLDAQAAAYVPAPGVSGLDTDGATIVLPPELGREPLPIRRRAAALALRALLDADARIESASVDAVLAGYTDTGMNSGYVNNVQGDLAVSANKHGVRIEPMAAFRARRKRL